MLVVPAFKIYLMKLYVYLFLGVLMAACNTARIKDKRLNRDKALLTPELRAMCDADQEGRLFLRALKKQQLPTPVYKRKRDSVWKLQTPIDKKNTERLIAITRKYGFPNIERLGAPVAAWLIFQHTPDEYRKEVSKLLAKEDKAGRMPDIEYLMLKWHLGGRKEPPLKELKTKGVKVKVNEQHTKLTVVIIISEDGDKTTDMVMEWLTALGAKAKRLNVSTCSKIAVRLSNTNLTISTDGVHPDKIWIRRGRLQCVPAEVRSSAFNAYIKKEERPIIGFHEYILKETTRFTGSYEEESENNKLLNLHIAKDCGFMIPETLVTNMKPEARAFLEKHEKIISKCIFHPPKFHRNGYTFNSVGTFVVEKKHIDFLADNFSPTLFQKYIEKAYEVRVFLYEDKLYAMAILSQQDEKTKVDFRNYNHEKPNRNIPFKLPGAVRAKIKKFMVLKKMNTGSIDFIVTPDNEFVFLEINPQGQLHWLSLNCNYYIEKDIALHLSK